MTVGMHAVNLANKLLNWLGGSTPTAPTNTYAKLHVGDPGGAGTSNASAETTRKVMAWSAASGGSKAMNGALTWSGWSAGPETLSHVSVWDDPTAGNFLYSMAATASKGVANGDDVKLNTHTFALSPIAA